ncbi:MAG TPA: Gfo/Idh/MocA family oxidoreductase [Planctomycetes bacterium]|nr:Gfo/Idh/MocA family oxidoreductase [Planctomycetota bacterium]
MTNDEGIGVGVIGLGFMGHTHLAAYASARATGRPNRIVALCDTDPERALERARASGNLDTKAHDALIDRERVALLRDPEELLARDDVELVSITTPTPTHVELATAALARGKHVLVEKPVALTTAEVLRVVDAARAADRICMPGLCMRFWPGWSWLFDAVRHGTYGAVHSASFRRLSPRPTWSPGFYDDPANSGGALFDLHVHDADLVQWLFGLPERVRSNGTIDHVVTHYEYPDGPGEVVAEGSWELAPGEAFRMEFDVRFERARASFVLGRDPELVFDTPGRHRPVRPVARTTGYEEEIRHLLARLAGEADPVATIEDAVPLTRLLEAERASLSEGRPVRP